MKFLLIIFISLVVSVADHDNEYKYYETHMPRDLGFLNLNEKQREAIREVLSKNAESLEKLHESEEKTEKRLKKIFLQKKFDREKFENELLKLKKRAVKIEAEMFEKIHKILTPEQRERFIEYMEEWEVE
ncbi:Spy/CpxP family protein refolding chaperone [Nitrosophilus alvini]|uniref:Spy/CpxP family protein refolding chaperone n=1 Tax=Nitrosophilus alvini TaxID=2714855 RepID=UPI00190BB94E|nr:Spy/CpxP family protein refolding chaperone [Nitrosophilus alvini]